MSNECFNCAGPASDQYTLILPDGKALENKTICEPCISNFRETEWLNVIEGPVMMRGETAQAEQDEGEDE